MFTIKGTAKMRLHGNTVTANFNVYAEIATKPITIGNLV